MKAIFSAALRCGVIMSALRPRLPTVLWLVISCIVHASAVAGSSLPAWTTSTSRVLPSACQKALPSTLRLDRKRLTVDLWHLSLTYKQLHAYQLHRACFQCVRSSVTMNECKMTTSQSRQCTVCWGNSEPSSAFSSLMSILS